MRSASWLFFKTFCIKSSQNSTCQNIIVCNLRAKHQVKNNRKRWDQQSWIKEKYWSNISSSSPLLLIVDRLCWFQMFCAMFVMLLGLFSFDHRFLFIIKLLSESSSEKIRERSENNYRVCDVEGLISKHRSQVEINRCFLLFIMIEDSTEGDQFRTNRWRRRTWRFLKTDKDKSVYKIWRKVKTILKKI